MYRFGVTVKMDLLKKKHYDKDEVDKFIADEKVTISATKEQEEPIVDKKNKLAFIVGGIVSLLVIGIGVFVGIYYAHTITVPQAQQYIVHDSTINPCDDFKELKCNVEWKIDENVKRGNLLSQSLAAKSRASKNSEINLIYSSGPAAGKFPMTLGKPIEQVKQELYDAGLNLTEVKIVDTNSDKPANTVIKSSIKEGADIKNGDTVSLEVTSGKVALPDYTGKTKEFVEVEAKKIGLTVTFKEEESDKPVGTVLSQSPKSGEVLSNTEIVVTIAKAATSKDIVVPDVVGKSAEDAQSALAAAGFKQIKTVVVKNNEVKSKQVTQVVPEVGQTGKSEENVILIVSEPLS